jgi:hypothetical protein
LLLLLLLLLLLPLWLLLQYTLRGVGDAGLFMAGTKVFSVSSKCSAMASLTRVMCSSHYTACLASPSTVIQWWNFNRNREHMLSDVVPACRLGCAVQLGHR